MPVVTGLWTLSKLFVAPRDKSRSAVLVAPCSRVEPIALPENHKLFLFSLILLVILLHQLLYIHQFLTDFLRFSGPAN